MKIKFYFMIFISLLNNSCGNNLLKDLAKKDSKEALYEDALILINNQEYQAAIDKIGSIPDQDFLARTDVKTTLIGAYAGLCGLNFINFFNSISGSSTSSFFKLVMVPFGGLSVNPAACDTAQALMESLGTLTSRTNDQKLFLAILGMVKMGVNFRERFDTEGSVGNGTVDAGINVCTNGSASGQMTDDQVKKVIVGMGLLIENFVGLSASLSGSTAVSAIEDVQDQCSTLGITCTLTDEDTVDASTVTAFRLLMDSTAFGFGSCDISTPLTCCI